MVGALALSGVTTYKIVRDNMMSAIAGTLDAVANGNASAIERWSADKAQAVSATAAVVEKGDPRGLTRLMGQTNDFPITSVGWSDKTFFSTANTPADYDPTSRPWYKSAVESGKLTVTKPYGDSGTGKPYVAFTTPIVREGKTIGALSGAVALDGVKAIIQAIHPTPSSLAFVLGSDGQVISHVDDKFALKPATEVAPELARGAQGPGARRRRAGGDHAGRRREAGQGQAHSRHRLVSGGGAGQGRGHGGTDAGVQRHADRAGGADAGRAGHRQPDHLARLQAPVRRARRDGHDRLGRWRHDAPAGRGGPR